MLVLFSSIFLVDTKTIPGKNFKAVLNKNRLEIFIIKIAI